MLFPPIQQWLVIDQWHHQRVQWLPELEEVTNKGFSGFGIRCISENMGSIIRINFCRAELTDMLVRLVYNEVTVCLVTLTECFQQRRVFVLCLK